jgi:hypothetical protein
VTIPILPSSDFDDTSAFFNGLGFEETGRWHGRYLILEHPVGIELHFFTSTALAPESNDHGAYIRFSSAHEVDELFGAWANVDLDGGRLIPPSNTEYGLREFALLDTMRNLLRIGGRLHG